MAFEVTEPGSGPLSTEASAPKTSSCFFCQLPKPHNPVKIGEICGPNPMEVVCANAASQEEIDRQANRRINTAITKARTEALNALGYSSLIDGIKQRLAVFDIPFDGKKFIVRQGDKQGDLGKLSRGLSGKSGCDRFKVAGSSADLQNDQIPPEVMAAIRSGNAEFNASKGKAATSPKGDAEQIKLELRQARESVANVQTALNRLRAHDLRAFFSSFVNRCGAIKEKTIPPESRSPVYRQFRSHCQRLPNLEQEVSDVLRIENSQLARNEFVRRYSYIDQLTLEPLPKATASEAVVLQRNLDNARSMFTHLCSEYADMASKVAFVEMENLFRLAHTSQIFQESLHSSLYQSEEMGGYKSLVEAARRATLVHTQSIPRIGHEKIIQSITRVEAFIPPLPPRSLYKTESGISVLNEIKLNNSVEHQNLLDFFSYQLDSQRKHQAYYDGMRGIYCQHVRAHLPTMMLAQTNPYFLFGFIGHEFGHDLDPNYADQNGLDMKAFHDQAISCYQSQNSIQMRPEQKGEVLADTIAAGLIGEQLQQLDQDLRASAMIEAMKPYCRMANEGLRYFDKTLHAIPSWRVNGIYFAHPKIRQALACDDKKSGYNFKICPPTDSI